MTNEDICCSVPRFAYKSAVKPTYRYCDEKSLKTLQCDARVLLDYIFNMPLRYDVPAWTPVTHNRVTVFGKLFVHNF